MYKKKNYEVHLEYKEQLDSDPVYFACVVNGKRGYEEKARQILFDHKGPGFSCVVEDSFCMGETEEETGKIIMC